MAAKQLLPFRLGTRQRFANFGSVAYTPGATLPSILLPRVGFLSRIFISLRASVTFGATATLNTSATTVPAAALLNRIRVNANIGSASLVDMSGISGYQMMRLAQGVGVSGNDGGIGGGGQSADIFALPTTGTAVPLNVSWVINIAANTGKQFDLGLINLQSPETQVSLDMVAGQLTDCYATNAPTIVSASVFAAYEYYEVPDPRTYQMPRLALVRTLEDQQPISAVGQQIYTLPRQGVLMQLMQRIILNNAPSDLVDSFGIRFNKTDTVYNWDRQISRFNERIRYGVNPYTGVYYHDFWFTEGDVTQGDARDAIDTEELSTLEVLPSINSGATIGAVASLATVRKIVQILQAA